MCAWPGNCPDVSRVDYHARRATQERVYEVLIGDVTTACWDTWNEFQPNDVMDRGTRQ